MRPRRAAAIAAGSAPLAAILVACSLGLDPSKIGQLPMGDDGPAGDDNVTGDSPAVEGGGPVPNVQCNTDKECQQLGASAGSCIDGARCDPTWHVCMFDVCVKAAGGPCKASVCTLATKTCTVPGNTPYKFAAGHFTVPFGGVGPAGPRYSIAAVFPFLFVATNNGVVAFNVADPTNSAPQQVDVKGVPFIVGAVIAVGRRVYFVDTTVRGAGPNAFRQAFAWLDVPQNPFVPQFVAEPSPAGTGGSAFVPTPDNSLSAVFTNGTDGLFVVYSSSGSSFFPTANVVAPLDDAKTLTPYAIAGFPTGATPGASSGSRLVAYRYEGSSNVYHFTLIAGAGTSSPQVSVEQAFNAFGPAAQQLSLTTGGDGSIVWQSAPFDVSDGGPDGISSARLGWLYGDKNAANFDTTHVDLEVYSPPVAMGTTVVGPSAWMDATTMVGLAAAKENPQSTSVQVASKNPPSVQQNKRTLLSIDPGSVGAASSGGFAYVLAQDDPKNQTATVYVFAPACAGQ